LEKQRGTLVWFGIDCVSLFFLVEKLLLEKFFVSSPPPLLGDILAIVQNGELLLFWSSVFFLQQ